MIQILLFILSNLFDSTLEIVLYPGLSLGTSTMWRLGLYIQKQYFEIHLKRQADTGIHNFKRDT